MFYAIRFWYVSIPLLIYLFYKFMKNKKRSDFSKTTGLDPDNEVKLKEDPIIKDEDDE